jgi:hypothetical protein
MVLLIASSGEMPIDHCLFLGRGGLPLARKLNLDGVEKAVAFVLRELIKHLRVGMSRSELNTMFSYLANTVFKI